MARWRLFPRSISKRPIPSGEAWWGRCHRRPRPVGDLRSGHAGLWWWWMVVSTSPTSGPCIGPPLVLLGRSPIPAGTLTIPGGPSGPAGCPGCAAWSRTPPRPRPGRSAPAAPRRAGCRRGTADASTVGDQLHLGASTKIVEQVGEIAQQRSISSRCTTTHLRIEQPDWSNPPSGPAHTAATTFRPGQQHRARERCACNDRSGPVGSVRSSQKGLTRPDSPGPRG